MMTPTEVGKNASIIKAAQEDLSVTDVLVCGRCHSVFHFIEEFKIHKDKPCQKEDSSIRDYTDTNPKMWAFLLWKEAQLQKRNINNLNRNSWALYQKWVKIDESQRNTWIIAGRTIQSFARVGRSGLTEMPVKITKTVVNKDTPTQRKPLSQTKPQVANLKAPLRQPPSKLMAKGSENDSNSVRSTPVVQKTVYRAVNESNSKTSNINDKLDIINRRRAKRTNQETNEITEENVERIVAKRINPRRKMPEYLVKWEKREHDDNTWEPQTHLDNVQHLLEIFEKQLARQKELRAMEAKRQVVLTKQYAVKKEESPSAISSTNLNSPDSVNRGIRNLKSIPLDQAKQWTGGAVGTNTPSLVSSQGSALGEIKTEMSMNSTVSSLGTSAVKRKLDEADSTKTEFTTMEDLEEDLIPSHTVKRLKNGSSVSVEVKTKTEKNIESKVIKVNGVNETASPSSLDSADVIITQDPHASGIFKKPGYDNVSKVNKETPQKPEGNVRILSKSEAVVSSSGIVRINSDELKSTTLKPQTIRVGGGGGGPTNMNLTNSARQTVQRTTPGGATIQRRTVSNVNRNNIPPAAVRTTAQPAPQGRQFMMRSTQRPINTPNTPTPAPNTPKTVTPEQKILQLSKSGDLKVTKKVVTREEPSTPARLNTQQQRTQQQQQRHQVQQQQQQQQQQQSQVQIQKVQQLAHNSPRESTTASITVRSSKPVEESQPPQLCSIAAKSEPEPQAAALHGQIAAAVAEHHQSNAAIQQQIKEDTAASMLLATEQQILTNEEGAPLFVTGDDGTVYQVAGKNAEGQTILVTQGPDGEQQYAYIATTDSDENAVLSLDNAVAEAVAQLPAEQQAEALAAAGEGQYLVKTTQEDGTTQVVTMTESELAQHPNLVAQQQQQQQQQSAVGGPTPGQLCIQTDSGDGQEANIPAEVVQADLPSPGGTRKVVLLLQDGSYMMTQMHEDEFKALNINL